MADLKLNDGRTLEEVSPGHWRARMIECPHCGQRIIDNSDGRHPCAWCGKRNERPALEAAYFVPRSQVWEGSRGRQSGRVHLRLAGEERTLCGRKRGWYERPSEETDPRCSRCEARAGRDGLDWPGA